MMRREHLVLHCDDRSGRLVRCFEHTSERTLAAMAYPI